MANAKAEELARDVVVGDVAAQKIPAGGVVTSCTDCGSPCLLDAKRVRELGQRPAAVVVCSVCDGKARLPGSAERQLAKVLEASRQAGAPVGDELLRAIEQISMQVAPDEITTYYDFDPPSAAHSCQASRKELPDRWTWHWTNDTGTPVLLTLRNRPEGEVPTQYMVLHGDELKAEAPKLPPVPPGFFAPKKRPIRDNPQA